MINDEVKNNLKGLLENRKVPRYIQVKESGGLLFTILIPKELHKRTHKLARILKTSITQIARDGLLNQVRELEEKIRIEQEEKKQAGFKPMDPLRISPEKKPVPEQPSIDYQKYALHIYEAVSAGSTIETRLRLAEAVADIKKKHPLTHPPEAEITTALERLVLKLKNEAPVPETVIDPTKIKTAIGETSSRRYD